VIPPIGHFSEANTTVFGVYFGGITAIADITIEAGANIVDRPLAVKALVTNPSSWSANRPIISLESKKGLVRYQS
jgi:hypothetical protein